MQGKWKEEGKRGGGTTVDEIFFTIIDKVL